MLSNAYWRASELDIFICKGPFNGNCRLIVREYLKVCV
jgi:hypothetical protein